MQTSLQSSLQALAAQFAEQVMIAIRGASVRELFAETSSTSRPTPVRPTQSPKSPGRLSRRSADDLARVVDDITALLEKHKAGLRAEQIREMLGLDRKELPRPLKFGLGSRRFRSRGHRRATTYFVG